MQFGGSTRVDPAFSQAGPATILNTALYRPTVLLRPQLGAFARAPFFPLFSRYDDPAHSTPGIEIKLRNRFRITLPIPPFNPLFGPMRKPELDQIKFLPAWGGGVPPKIQYILERASHQLIEKKNFEQGEKLLFVRWPVSNHSARQSGSISLSHQMGNVNISMYV